MITKKILLLVPFAAISVSFQNCGNGVGYTSSTSSPSVSSLSPAPSGDVLGQIDFANISEINVDAKVGSGNYSAESRAVTVLNGTARTLDTQLTFLGAGAQLAGCHVLGTNADFSVLEDALKSMTIAPTHSGSIGASLGSLQLTLKMKDGSQKAFSIDASNGASIGGLQSVNASALRSEIMSMNASGQCTQSLGNLPSIPGFTLPSF